MNTKELYNIASGKAEMPVQPNTELEDQANLLTEADFFVWRELEITKKKINTIELKMQEAMDAAMNSAMAGYKDSALNQLIRAHALREVVRELVLNKKV